MSVDGATTGPAAARWFGAGPCPFALLAAEPVGDGLVWVRYRPR